MYWHQVRSDTHSNDITDASAALPEDDEQLLTVRCYTDIICWQTGIYETCGRIDKDPPGRDPGGKYRGRDAVVKPEYVIHTVRIDHTRISLVLGMIAYCEIPPKGEQEQNAQDHIILYTDLWSLQDSIC